MIDFFFWVSYVGLWTVVLVLFAAVFFLYRHHGQMLLDSREGRANQGPQLDKPLPVTRLFDIDGAEVMLGTSASMRPVFVFFASTKCRPCLRAREAFGAFAERHQLAMDALLICRGKKEQVATFAAILPKCIRIIPDPKWNVGTQLRVSSTPFAIVSDSTGFVRAKGMPDSLNAFEWFTDQLQSKENLQIGIYPSTSQYGSA